MSRLLWSFLVAALVAPVTASPPVAAPDVPLSAQAHHQGHWEYGVEYLDEYACWVNVGFYLTIDEAESVAFKWELRGYSTDINAIWVADQ
jgi:hypothetical protein